MNDTRKKSQARTVDQATTPHELSLADVAALYQKLEINLQQLITAIRGTKQTHLLFRVLMLQARLITREKDRAKRLPPFLIEEINEIIEEGLSRLKAQRLKRRRSLTPANIDNNADLSKIIIDDVKYVADFLTLKPDLAYDSWHSVSIDSIRAQLLQCIPDLKFTHGEFGYKGGVARVALKLWAAQRYPGSFPQAILDAEIPLADKDAVIGPTLAKQKWEIATAMGVDPDGIELRTDFDVGTYLNSRDCDMNQCLITSTQLHFTNEAVLSVLSGVVHAKSRESSLFGTDTYVYKHKTYHSARMVHRLIKTVIDGKALAFEIPTYNAEVSIGIYWLVLIRKWHRKPGLGVRLGQMFSCAQQLGQDVIGSGDDLRKAKTPLEFFQWIAQKYPGFNFSTHSSNHDIAAWIIEKLVTLINRHLRQKFSIRPGDWPYQSEDHRPLRVQPSLRQISAEQIREVEEWMNAHAAALKTLESASETVPDDSPILGGDRSED